MTPYPHCLLELGMGAPMILGLLKIVWNSVIYSDSVREVRPPEGNESHLLKMIIPGYKTMGNL